MGDPIVEASEENRDASQMEKGQVMEVDDAFFNRTGLERIGVVGPDLDCRRAGLQALALLSSAKTRKKGGRRGLRPWPLRCLSQFFPKRKYGLLRGRMCCVPFTDRVA